MPSLVSEPHQLVCTAEGVFVWPGTALVVKRGASFARVSDRDIGNLAGALFGAEIVYGPLIPTLERAARFLERGQLSEAQETIAQLKLPPLTATGEQLMRIAPNFFDPDKHPRWPAGQSDGGQFRPADGSGDGNGLPAIVPVADFSGGFHRAVVDAWMDFFREKGIPAVDEPLIQSVGTLGVVGGRPDIIVNDPSLGLPWTVFEIKTGDDPTFTPAQAAYYPLLQLGGHIYSWDPRIRSLGLTPGVTFPPMGVMIVYAPGPGEHYIYKELPPPKLVKFRGIQWSGMLLSP